MPPDAPIILILGPTAGGKTSLAIALANQLPGGGECICADSMQVYREMDIGTAKPTPEERASAPHHLLDMIDPADDGFSVDTWLEQCEQTVRDIRGRGRGNFRGRGGWPIVVGGTNLYIQALLEGLFEGPEPDTTLRAELAGVDLIELRRRLEEVDPESAARIHSNDRKRTVRALEVHTLTGQTISALQQQWHRGKRREDVVIVGLEWSVEAINRRINERVRQMVAEGLVDEVRRLWEADRLGHQAREALGYKQIIDHLESRCSLDEAVEQIKIRTRRYAKQQRTWLRRFRQFEPGLWLEADHIDTQTLVNKSLTFVVRHAPDRP